MAVTHDAGEVRRNCALNLKTIIPMRAQVPMIPSVTMLMMEETIPALAPNSIVDRMQKVYRDASPKAISPQEVNAATPRRNGRMTMTDALKE
jgi:hypothetical protein